MSRIDNQKFKEEDFDCPDENCEEEVSFFIIENLLKNQEFQNYYNRMIRMQLQNMKSSDKNIKYV